MILIYLLLVLVNMQNFQLMSDIHFETKNISELPSVKELGEIMIIAGDLGNPYEDKTEKLLKNYTELFDTVFLIAGNHEFYGNEYFSTKERMKDLASISKKVVFLDNNSTVIDGVRFIGSTLWSNIPESSFEKLNEYMHDPRRVFYIKYRGETEKKKFGCSDMNLIYQQNIEYLKSEFVLAKKRNEKVVVITHHAPLIKGVANPEFEDPKNIYFALFASDLKSMMDKDVIDTWIFGHTHWFSNQDVNGVRVVANQVGYLSDYGKIGYKDNYVIKYPYDVKYNVEKEEYAKT